MPWLDSPGTHFHENYAVQRDVFGGLALVKASGLSEIESK